MVADCVAHLVWELASEVEGQTSTLDNWWTGAADEGQVWWKGSHSTEVKSSGYSGNSKIQVSQGNAEQYFTYVETLLSSTIYTITFHSVFFVSLPHVWP